MARALPVGVAPGRFRNIVLVAALFQALIILSGAAVRLTDAGLGCEDWPRCSEDRLVPEFELHGWIEFGNRLISLVVAATAVAVVVGAHRRRPRRSDLIRPAWALLLGTVFQAVLGGITVLVDLHPAFVAVHFLASMVLLWVSLVLWFRANGGPGRPHPTVSESLVGHSRMAVAAAVAVLVTGSVVTGTGPNGGDSRADRLAFDLEAVARVHSLTVWLLVGVAVGLAVRIRRTGTGPASTMVTAVLLAVLVQGAIGYTQFSMGVPPILVEAHVLGSIVVWGLVLATHLSLFDRGTEEPASDAASPHSTAASTSAPASA